MQSGESAINLATIGDATVVNDAWMLETYLERFGRPNKVVIVHAYDIWHRELKQNVVVQIPFKSFGTGFRHTLMPAISEVP